MKKTKNKRGFTLIELIVVMAVIGILVLLAAPKFLGYTKDANVTAMQSDAKILSNAALMYNIDEENFPTGDVVDNATLDVKLVDYLKNLGFNPVAVSDNPGTPTVDESAPADTAVRFNDTTKTELSGYVKNIKGDFSDYILVTSGTLEGEVFHFTGIDNKENITQYGLVENK